MTIHGFIWRIGGRLTTMVDDPNASGVTILNGINNKGDIVGYYRTPRLPRPPRLPGLLSLLPRPLRFAVPTGHGRRHPLAVGGHDHLPAKHPNSV